MSGLRHGQIAWQRNSGRIKQKCENKLFRHFKHDTTLAIKNRRMFRIQLLTAIRHICRFRSLSAITILGLAVGFTCIILLSTWIGYEYQYDRFYKKADRIYKVFLEEGENGNINKHPWVSFPVAKTLKEEVPEIENSTVVTDGSIKVKYNDFIFYENHVCFTDPQIFKIFDFGFSRGKKDLVLQHKNSIVISEKIAQKYFHDENPVGKILFVNDDYSFEVTAVVEKIPQNSSFNFDIFILAEYFADPFIFCGTNWEALNFNSYVRLREGVSPEVVREKIRDIFMKHVPDGRRYLNIQPIKASHFYSVAGDPANIKNIRILIILGLVIFFVAVFNFFNISIGRYQKRASEFKTKGIIGAGEKQHFFQLLTENILILLMAVILSLIFSVLILPLTGELLGVQFSNNMIFSSIPMWTASSAFGTALIAGTWLLLFICRQYMIPRPVYLNRTGKSKRASQSVFVTLQFTFAILLLIGVFVITKQLDFISRKDIGLDPQNVVTVPLKGSDRNKYLILKEELLRNSAVKSVSAAYNLPTNVGTRCVITTWPGNPHQEKLELNYTVADKDYFSTLGMNIVAGIPFSEKLKSDTVAYILNEQAVAAMHLKEPVGAEIDFSCWTKGKVIGVVKDFNYRSVHSPIGPLIVVNHLWGAQHLLIKLNRKPNSALFNDIENIWEKINPESPFNIRPLDSKIEEMYLADKRFRDLLFICSVIAIVLSSVGLFGLVLMFLQHRTKEIGIRKVNGAKISEILAMLNKDFVKWVAIAFVIATPIAWYAMHKWLENFAYKTELSWWIFALAGVLALGIALLTVSWQSWRAATRNPVEALRYE
jgi:putative ABC transport system permease protein